MDKVRPLDEPNADVYVIGKISELVQAVNELIEKVDRLHDLYKVLYSATKQDVRRALNSTLTQVDKELNSLDGPLSGIGSVECELMDKLAPQTTLELDWTMSDEDVQVQEVVHNKICQVIRGAVK